MAPSNQDARKENEKTIVHSNHKPIPYNLNPGTKSGFGRSHYVHDYDDNGTTTTPAVLRHGRRQRSKFGILCGICFIIVTMGLVVGIAVYFLYRNDNNDNQDSNSSRERQNNPSQLVSLTPTVSPTEAGPQRCNGMESLCDIAANRVYYATLHNAAYTAEDGAVVLPNHARSLEEALNAGYRGINMDLGKCTDSGLRLLHTTCLLASRDPIEVFSNILSFLSKNPNEVILLPIQIENSAEGGNVTLNEIYKNLIQKVDGLSDMLYTHPRPPVTNSTSSNNTDGASDTATFTASSSDWPTLRQLIDSGTRIMMFHYDAVQQCSQLNGGVCPPGMQEWFSYAAETQFQLESVDSFSANLTYSCELTRGTEPRNQSDFLGINLFTSIPSIDSSSTLNSAKFIKSHVNACMNQYGYRKPNVLLVDFWDVGGVLDIVEQWNGEL